MADDSEGRSCGAGAIHLKVAPTGEGAPRGLEILGELGALADAGDTQVAGTELNADDVAL